MTEPHLISTERCMCGHPSCKDVWLVGIGKFMQGAGFTTLEAEEIVKAVNAARRAKVAAKRRREPRPPLHINVSVGTASGGYRVVFTRDGRHCLGVFRRGKRFERFVRPEGRVGRRIVKMARESLT